MSNITQFLEENVPNILKDVQSDHEFFVVGTRAVNAYVMPTKEFQSGSLSGPRYDAFHAKDWDIVHVGSGIDHNLFVEKIKNKLTKQSYKVRIESHQHDSPSRESPFDLHSRDWTRISINLADNIYITAVDIYHLSAIPPGMGVFMIKNGLLYSDLGFLVRELNREEENAKKNIQELSKFDSQEISNKLAVSSKELQAVDMNLDVWSSQMDEFEESTDLDQAPDFLQDKLQDLEKAKKSLIRITKEREALFNTMLAGKANKLMVHKICKVCRDLESSFGKYQSLKAQCNEVKKLCKKLVLS